MPFLLAGCQNSKNKLNYTIEKDTEIRITYYAVDSFDPENLSYYNILLLPINGKQLLEYDIFQKLINKSKKVKFGYGGVIIRRIPFGSYEIDIYKNNICELEILVQVNDSQQIEAEIYTIKDRKQFEKFTVEMPSENDIKNFMQYVQENDIWTTRDFN